MKQTPRWASPKYRAATRKDPARSGEFNQKASHVLRRNGFTQPAAAKVLGISERMVRHYQSKPCPALETERAEAHQRTRWEQLSRTKRGSAPFDVWAYLRAAQPPLVANLLGFDPWAVEGIGSTTKERVTFYLMDGWTPVEISRLLGITRQAVDKHVRAIRERVEIAMKRRAAHLKSR